MHTSNSARNRADDPGSHGMMYEHEPQDYAQALLVFARWRT